MQSVTYIFTHIPDCFVKWAVIPQYVFLLSSVLIVFQTLVPCWKSITQTLLLGLYFTVSPPVHHLPTNAFIFRSAGHVLGFWGLSGAIIVLISDESCPNTDSVTSHCDISSSYKGVEKIFQQSKTSVTASPWCQSFRWKEKVYVLQTILQQPRISFTERNPSPQRQWYRFLQGSLSNTEGNTAIQRFEWRVSLALCDCAHWALLQWHYRNKCGT